MTVKPKAELIFEKFCSTNGIWFGRIEECDQPTPDYIVILGEQTLFVEVKQIDKDDNFSNETSSKRTVGAHIRKKIQQARKQAQTVSNSETPFVLLVYNNLDGAHLFGTEPHDFVDAMYGETTLLFDKSKNKITDSFQGRNQSLSDGKNTSFSAIGHLKESESRIGVKIFENIFAKNKLDFSRIPGSIEVIRIEVENGCA